jgi:hypothetical protein
MGKVRKILVEKPAVRHTSESKCSGVWEGNGWYRNRAYGCVVDSSSILYEHGNKMTGFIKYEMFPKDMRTLEFQSKFL